MMTIASGVQPGAYLLPNGLGARFCLWAPNAKEVVVHLSSPGTGGVSRIALDLDAMNPGYWIAEVSVARVGMLYQFEITNRGGDSYDPGGLPLLRTDPCARQVTSSDPTLPALLIDPTTYLFRAPFQTPSFENFILYQAHIGSFAGRNDGLIVSQDANGGSASFSQCEEKLEYIKSMNFNAIQFLPTGEYRGLEGEAYNPSNYYAPEVLYGAPDDLRRLVDACHQRGLAVFLDMVYNHMDSSHNLWQFDGNTSHRTDESDARTGGGIYFSTIETGFGRRPDHDSPEVQRFFIENAAMWFREYHVDGLRFDSAANFSEGGLKAIVQALLTEFPDKFIYAEDSNPNYIFNDIGFCACWDMASADTFAHVVANGDILGLQNLLGRFGYPHAYSAIKYLLGSHDQIFNQWIYDDVSRSGYWGKPGTDGLRENRYFVERIGGEVTGRENWYARAQARLGWVLNVTMPCTPMLFMGSECYHYGYWNPANDLYGDHRLDWSIVGDTLGLEMRSLVRDINALRWQHPVLRSDSALLLPHLDLQNRILAFQRGNENGDALVVIVNLGDQQWDDATYGVKIGVAGEQWYEIFNSQALEYGGWSNSGNSALHLVVGSDGQLYIRMPKWSVLLFQRMA